MMNSSEYEDQNELDYRFAVMAYKFRWVTAILLILAVGFLFSSGGERIGQVTSSVMEISDISNGGGTIDAQVFDPSLDVWFDTGDSTVQAYFDIEDRFIAEDYILVTFKDDSTPYGVFSKESLTTIQRLTEQFLTVPGVRHVRSLTYSPWIRWGEIRDNNSSSLDETESGLIISDLVETSPTYLNENEIIERMVAVLGANRAAQRVGEDRVRAVLGSQANFDDYIGEPLLLGAIVNDNATTTAIQIQVIRPNIDNIPESVTEKNNEEQLKLVKNLYAVQFQRATLRGIEHFLNLEKGVGVKAAGYTELENWIASMPLGEEREALELELKNPTKNFMKGKDDILYKKYHQYSLSPEGKYMDISDPAAPVEAPADFAPDAKSAYQFRLGGVPILERNFEIVGKADSKYLPLMFLVIMITLVVAFRGVAGLLVPMIVVIASILGTVGSIFAMGNLFNNLTAMIPNMLTAIGLADAVHLVAAWLIMRADYDNKRDLIVNVIRKNAMPVLLTSITTAVGFYSLVLSELTPVKQLGVAMTIGTLLAYLITMTIVPALLSIFPHRKDRAKRKFTGLFTESRANNLADVVIRSRKSIVVCSFTIVVAACAGLFFLQIDADQRAMFKDGNPVIMDLIWIEEELGGTGDLEIIFDSVSDDTTAPALTTNESNTLKDLQIRKAAANSNLVEASRLTAGEEEQLSTLTNKQERWNASRIGVSPEFLKSVDGFEARLREEMVKPGSPLAIITDLTSPLDILRKMHQVQNRNDSNYYRVIGENDIPEQSRQESLVYDEFIEEWDLIPGQNASKLIAQYYLQYENGARPGENLSAQLSLDRRHFRMQGRGLLCTTQEKQAAIARIKEIAQTEFPKLALNSENSSAISDLTISGKKTLMDRTGIIIAEGFVKSISVALVVIIIMIGLFFRSWKLALISILPNVLPITIPLGIFGWLGIMLDGPAIVVACVGLGVCVDDTIHFFTKYTRAMNSGKSNQQAISQAIRECGDALTVTTIILIIGFGTMLLSVFSPNYLMGVLVTSIIGLAWLADFIVTPAILAVTSDEESSKEGSTVDENVSVEPSLNRATA